MTSEKERALKSVYSFEVFLFLLKLPFECYCRQRVSRNTHCICFSFRALHAFKKKKKRPTFQSRHTIQSCLFVFPCQDTDEFILPTGANKTRGRFELAFFTIGGCCMTGRWSCLYVSQLSR